MVRTRQIYPLLTPPGIKYITGILVLKGKEIDLKQGTVFWRISNVIYKHFGIFFGIDKFNTAWFLELNIDGINFVTHQDFLAGYPFVYKGEKYKDVEWETLYTRAKERSAHSYHFRENNCEAFVEYLFNLKLVSQQTENTEHLLEVMIRGAKAAFIRDHPKDDAKENVGWFFDNMLNQAKLNKLNDDFTLKSTNPPKIDIKAVVESFYLKDN